MDGIYQKMKMRDESIDITKGILISLLIFHHIVDFGAREFGVVNPVLEMMRVVQRPLILCYFMQAFFLITGICSDFMCECRTFIFKQVRMLIIPAFVFSFFMMYYSKQTSFCSFVSNFLVTGGKFWFLIAMFGAKIGYYFVRRIVRHRLYLAIVIGVVLSFLGTALNESNLIPNYYWHRQAFDLFLFIAIGDGLKNYVRNRRVAIVSFSIYVGLAACSLFIGTRLPYVTAGFGTTAATWPIHVVLSVTGSIAVLALGRWIKKSSLMVLLGRNTLAIYLTQGFVLGLLLRPTFISLNGVSLLRSLAPVCFIFISTLAVGLFVAYVINNSVFRFVLGGRLR